MNKLTVALATRGRPEIMVETVKHMVKNAELDNTSIVVLMDEDDPASFEALKAANVGSKVVWSVEPREDTLGEKYNRVLSVEPADLYQVAVDYAPILTPGYDRRLLEAAKVFPDGIGVVYGPPANASFPTTQAPTARWVELTGGIYPGYFPFWFVDHWLDDVAKMVGRIRGLDVMELQVDCATRRGPSTLELRDVDFWAAFFDAGKLQRRRQAEKLLAAMDQPEWMKVVARSQWERIEARSRWINYTVQQQKTQIEAARGGTPPDERYLRVLAKAQALLPDWVKELEQNFTLVSPHEPQQHPQEFGWWLEKIKGAKSILEVGSCHGKSLEMMARAAGPGTKVRAIDMGILPGTKHNLEKTIQNLRAEGYDAEVKFGNSQDKEVVEWARDAGPFHAVFIDGDHDYLGARSDWANYGPMGNVVAFHDIAHPGHEVRKVWGEVKATGKPFVERVLSGMGIGVVFNVQ